MTGSYWTRPLVLLDVPKTVHDESVAVVIGSLALEAGVGRLRDRGTLTPRLFLELLELGSTCKVWHGASWDVLGGFSSLLKDQITSP